MLKAWHQLYQSNEPFLFGSHKTTVDLSTLHPQQVQIFRLWQIYLDNINPILKVTHTPTLQGLIVEAVGNMSSIEPTLAALMFSIYCVSIMSITDGECRTMFCLTREDLLTRYQFSCQQALLRCEVLRSSNRDCLTALYLYLVSLLGHTIPAWCNIFRSRSDQPQILSPCPLCSALQSGLRNAWDFTPSLLMPNAQLLRRKCAEGFGGRSYCLMLASPN